MMPFRSMSSSWPPKVHTWNTSPMMTIPITITFEELH
jgi:hypothetical protein